MATSLKVRWDSATLMQEMQRQFHYTDTSTRSSRTTSTQSTSRSWVEAISFGITKESNVMCTLHSQSGGTSNC